MVELKEYLEESFASAGGSMPVEKFMERALYDPDHGYYTVHIRDVGGRSADFTTWAAGPELGRAIARWVREEMGCLDWKRGSLIEVGGGDGALTDSILRSLGWLSRQSIDYHIVDVSEPLQKRQRDRLGRRSGRIRWHREMASALEACKGRALIISNELVDAFPVQWLRWNGEAWEEVWVGFDPGKGLREEFRPASARPDLEEPAPGQRVEVHRSYREWLCGWRPDFVEGAILTIDYGGLTARDVYHRRPGGTLRGYFRHQRVEGSGIYQRFGRQDLTSDVTFADLVNWGEEAGLKKTGLEDQASFMARYGEEIGDAEREAAEAFFVLHQRIGPVTDCGRTA